MVKNLLKLSAVAALAFAFVAAPVASAATTVVTPTSLNGWLLEAGADPNVGDPGTATFVADPTAEGDGALQLLTPDNNNAYAQASKEVNVPLSEVTDASYMTKTLNGPEYASASFAFGLDTNGDTTVDKYYIYEPYWQETGLGDPYPVVANTWQTWDVKEGLFWTDGTAGPPLVSFSDMLTANPTATVRAIYVYQGTYNPNYTVNVDMVTLNGTSYNFEQSQQKQVATNKEDCKTGGWKDLVTNTGKDFKNQGQCVAYVVSSENSKHHRETVTLDQTF